ncbi:MULTISPECIES: DMT family transporter [unclassified Brevibacterium]|uniref:DMT family transporter n=1 Tax=unclassified Brevibacterium TaxID=2614124 RepID=UPI0008A5EAB9|nr:MULTISPECIES: DMT family transporter [unclassified Brevibacterium]OFL64179.1 hypothetical protein HMPREF2757_01600 [Brevibacterium sp. HMSC063G07]OFS26411.1 hypothetical protein HMPREF3162_06450 [Brevibacterium sp. HMSC07C04]
MRSGPNLLYIFPAIATGLAVSLQGKYNGELTVEIGHWIYSAAVSFGGGLVLISIVTAILPAGRRAIATTVGLLRSKALPWWMCLGGLGGTTIVIAQGITVPAFGVAVFTMSFTSGQLLGALIVDSTRLPAGGPKPITLGRLVGVAVVLVGVAIVSAGAFTSGLQWWIPLIPFASGALTGLQHAFNGRLSAASGSALAATTMNFVVGLAALAVACAVVFAAGTPPLRFPSEPLLYSGGLFGVAFILVSALIVPRLGVLILSLSTLVGNMGGSLIIDAVAGSEQAFTPASLVSIGLVVLGVVIATLPGKPVIGGRRAVRSHIDVGS